MSDGSGGGRGGGDDLCRRGAEGGGSGRSRSAQARGGRRRLEAAAAGGHGRAAPAHGGKAGGRAVGAAAAREGVDGLLPGRWRIGERGNDLGLGMRIGEAARHRRPAIAVPPHAAALNGPCAAIAAQARHWAWHGPGTGTNRSGPDHSRAVLFRPVPVPAHRARPIWPAIDLTATQTCRAAGLRPASRQPSSMPGPAWPIHSLVERSDRRPQARVHSRTQGYFSKKKKIRTQGRCSLGVRTQSHCV